MCAAPASRSVLAAPAAGRRWLLGGMAAGTALWLAGCGFRLRGSNLAFAFNSLRLNAPSETAVVQNLADLLRASGVRVVGAGGTPVVAGEVQDVVLTVLQDQRERVVVGSTAAGQVRELQLRHRFRFQLRTPVGKELIAATELLQERDLSFTETQVLGKEMEEELLYTDMQDAVVRQLLFRLAALKAL